MRYFEIRSAILQSSFRESDIVVDMVSFLYKYKYEVSAPVALRAVKAATVFVAVSVLFSGNPAEAQTQARQTEFTENGLEYVSGEIIVKLKGKSKSLTAQAFVGKAVTEKSMTLKGSWSGLNMHQFKIANKTQMKTTLQDLKADPEVEYAEPNYILRAPGDVPEGHSAVSFSQARSAAAQVAGTSAVGIYAQTQAPIALPHTWAELSTTSGSPVVVAVIDTGVDYNHTIFQESGAIWTNEREIPNNGIDDDGNGYIDDVRGWNFVNGNNNPMDDNYHGTHVAGIVLGVTQDLFASPMAPAKIRIMPLKFLDADGAGATSDAVQAIYYAVNNGARVLNNSWGGGGYSRSLLDAVSYAYSHRVVFAAAAGNASSNNDAVPTYPAGYSVPNVISVAATNDYDVLASYSNYGAASVHVGAPGSGIWSSMPGNMFGSISGTSMATPFVAGLAATILYENTSLSAYQVRDLIFTGADPVRSLQNRTITKARINTFNSVLAAKTASGSSQQPAFSGRNPASDDDGAAVGGCGLVKALHDDIGGPGGTAQRNIVFFGLLAAFLAPILVAFMLRRQSGKSRRRYPRYQIASEVRMTVGGRELVGQVNSISLGGLAVATGVADVAEGSQGADPDAWLENGGVVAMVIKSPDGREEIKVAGRVVWSEEKKGYGVAFEGADSSVLNSIGRWTAGLLKSS